MNKKPFKKLPKVIEDLVTETKLSADKLVDTYKTFRFLEIVRNHDTHNYERMVNTAEDIIKSELSV